LSKDRFLRYLHRLRREKVNYIYGYASALVDFAKTIQHEQLDFSFVRGIFSSSDMLYPQQRKLIEQLVGTKIIDIYGNPESGLLSYECGEHQGFHYGMQNCYVEIVDAEGKSLPDGTVGKVIVTSLNNKCFPIIRYDTGDEASLSREQCPCGRGLLTIKNLGGRSRDYIVLSDGRHIHGAFFNHLHSLYAADWLERYHIAQQSKTHLTIQCLVSRQPSDVELNSITQEIRKGTGNLVDVEVQLVESIPMTTMGKYKLITREFSEE